MAIDTRDIFVPLISSIAGKNLNGSGLELGKGVYSYDWTEN